MALVFSVLGDSPEEAAAGLARMCERMGLEPLGPPVDYGRRDRWLGRAVDAEPGEPSDR